MHIEGACDCGLITFTAEVDPSRVMVLSLQRLSGTFRLALPGSSTCTR